MAKKIYTFPQHFLENVKNLEAIYGSNTISPKIIASFLSGKGVHTTHYNEYFKSDEVIKFLFENGEIIEINETKSLDSRNLTKVFYGGEEFIDSDKSYLFFYKKTFVRIIINEEIEFNSNKKENCKITFYTPIGEENVSSDFLKFINTSKNPRIFILNQEYGDFVFSKFSISLPEKFDIELNYGDGFTKINKKIIDSLESNHSGLYMFHGPPGTGKSTYIKYLASKVNKDAIFFPTSLIGNITSPEIVNLLVKKQNCILILEDAEKAIVKRDGNGEASLVSTLLNMTDGILGDVLKLNVIVTYNCKRAEIDEALLRKGRLKAEYSFDPLNKENAAKLIKKLKIKMEAEDKLTLADIYNYQKDEELIGKRENLTDKPRIGFVV